MPEQFIDYSFSRRFSAAKFRRNIRAAADYGARLFSRRYASEHFWYVIRLIDLRFNEDDIRCDDPLRYRHRLHRKYGNVRTV